MAELGAEVALAGQHFLACAATSRQGVSAAFPWLGEWKHVSPTRTTASRGIDRQTCASITGTFMAHFGALASSAAQSLVANVAAGKCDDLSSTAISHHGAVAALLGHTNLFPTEASLRELDFTRRTWTRVAGLGAAVHLA